jgi:hypothetical protein
MTAINLALRNLYGYVIHGNSLADEQRRIYQTGFNLRGFVREIPFGECPEPVQQAASAASMPADLIAADAPAISDAPSPSRPEKQLRLF